MDASTIIGGIAGFAGGIIASSLEKFWGFEHQRYGELVKLRHQPYMELWNILGVIRQFNRQSVTLGDLLKTNQDLSKWYFNGGGLLMSRKTQSAFQALQQKLQELIEPTTDLSVKVNDDYDCLLKCYFSPLRTQITEDLISRREILPAFFPSVDTN